MKTPSKIAVILACMMTVTLSVVALDMTLDQGLRSNDATVREKVLQDVLNKEATADVGLPKETFRMPLYDSDPKVRINAISVLRHRQIKDYNKDLLILLTEAQPTVRSAAAKALGELGTKETVTVPLWRSLKDPSKVVRREAIEAIDLLHGTRLGFYYDQDPARYRQKAQAALKEYLKIDDKEVDSHAEKIYGNPQNK